MRWAGGVTVVALLLAAVTAIRILVDEPGYGVAFYAVIPIVLAAFWLGRRGALVTAGAAAVVYLASELLYQPGPLSDGQLWTATLNRFVIYVIVAVAVTVLLDREQRLRRRVEQQEQRLEELEALQKALTPAELPARPGLELATAFIPAEGRVAGDFFLVVAGPADSTTIVVGDVVGHGIEAARRASFVRAVLATFAPFSSDPAQLLRLANTALTENLHEDGAEFVTAVCVNVAARSGRLRWASAGHCPPWLLDSGEAVASGLRTAPLGLRSDALRVETSSRVLRTGEGFVLFTDGLIEGRAAHRDPATPLALFGEEGVRKILTTHRGVCCADVVSALRTSVEDFAGGALADDVCVIACRLTAVSSSRPTDSSPARDERPAAPTDRISAEHAANHGGGRAESTTVRTARLVPALSRTSRACWRAPGALRRRPHP